MPRRPLQQHQGAVDQRRTRHALFVDGAHRQHEQHGAHALPLRRRDQGLMPTGEGVERAGQHGNGGGGLRQRMEHVQRGLALALELLLHRAQPQQAR